MTSNSLASDMCFVGQVRACRLLSYWCPVHTIPQPRIWQAIAQISRTNEISSSRWCPIINSILCYSVSGTGQTSPESVRHKGGERGAHIFSFLFLMALQDQDVNGYLDLVCTHKEGTVHAVVAWSRSGLISEIKMCPGK